MTSLRRRSTRRISDAAAGRRIGEDDALSAPEPVPIEVRPRRVVAVLAGVFVVLLVLHWIVIVFRYELGHRRLFGLVDRLNMDAEESFAQFLQMVHLLTIAALLFVVGHRARRRGERYATWWLVASAIFLYLTLDESSRIHEMAILPLQDRFDTSGPLFFAWLLVAIPLVVVFVVLSVPFLRSLDPWTRRRFLLAGLLYVSGTIGMEMLGGIWVEERAFDALYYYTYVPIEEAFEVSGQLLFLYALLMYVRRTQGAVTVRVLDGSERSSADRAVP